MTTYTVATSSTAPFGSRAEYLPGASGSTPKSAVRPVRAAIVATSDALLRQRLAHSLEDLRWDVRLAGGGAEAMAQLDTDTPSTLLVDSWLPDLEVRELVRELGEIYPHLDVLAIDGTDLGAPAARGAYRHEVLLALRAAHASDEAAWALAPTEGSILRGIADRSASSKTATIATEGLTRRSSDSRDVCVAGARIEAARMETTGEPRQQSEHNFSSAGRAAIAMALAERARFSAEAVKPATVSPLPEFIGSCAPMLEVSRRIRLVASRTTTVLIEGATGTGKELVARALHRLSPRASRSFVALNCAAIPEALLESELFGHTRGAFTGASQGRVGRIEAAHGGTLFLDEIGELPLALQAKLLRFLECGELQRVGENEPVRVDVRIVAATHRGLGAMAREGRFRADLFYRLSVFLIRTPSLSEHAADVPALVEHFLEVMGRTEPAKRLSPAALDALLEHTWPGNVRELEHVLERAWILAEDRPVIGTEEIEFGEPMF